MGRQFDRDYTAASGAAVAVTPNDSTDLTNTSRGLFVGTGGDVVVIFDKDTSSVTLKNIVSGSVLPVRIRRVLATGTTALNIVALY